MSHLYVLSGHVPKYHSVLLLLDAALCSFEGVVEAFEKAWQLTAPECEVYFR